MKYLFVVQGQGRGHMTQAIALSSILRANGHEVAGILVGKNKDACIPGYFSEKAGCEVEAFDSPNLLPVETGHQVSLLKSVIAGFRKSPRFLVSFRFLERKIEAFQPDVVVNFYELIISLLFEIKRPKVRFVCIAHQYFYLHPHFRFPKPRKTELAAFLYYTRLTCRKADKILALSLGTQPRYSSRKITVVPPLLRSDLLTLQSVSEDYILAYMVDNSFEKQLLKWHDEHPYQPIHAFGDRTQEKLTIAYDATMHFSQINDALFLERLSKCKAYATTAGFESVCEAIYLGKPVLMVPAHIEQYCNMIDAERAGAGIGSESFQLDKLLDYWESYSVNCDFKKWVATAEPRFLEQLT
jgi:uncharacterized protein (TIGR00661 family)